MNCMAKILTIISSKKLAFIGIFSIALFSYHAVSVRDLSHRKEQKLLLKEGMQTCLSRVAQTLTAGLLGQVGSSYLTTPFMATSEECFGEAIDSISAQSATTGRSLVRKLNLVATDVHWFHRQIQTSTKMSEVSLDQEVVSDLSTRFASIEAMVDIVIGRIEQAVEKIDSTISIFGYIFLGAIVLSLALVFELASLVRLKLKNGVLENQALGQMEQPLKVSEEETSELISKALEQNDLPHCAFLFSQFHTIRLDGRLSALIPLVDSEMDNDSAEVFLPFSDDVIDQPTEGTAALCTSLDSILSQGIDALRERVFTHGIKFSVDECEEIMVNCEEETTVTMLFHLISGMSDYCQESVDGKRVALHLQELGSSIVVTISASRSDESPVDQIEDDLNLNIAAELAGEIGTEIGYQAVYDNEKIVGHQAILSLPVADISSSSLSAETDVDQKGSDHKPVEPEQLSPAPSARLVKLVRGKKRDIIQQVR
jgi:hypothetical protein